MKRPEIKTRILSGVVEITDKAPIPFTTEVKVNGKNLSEVWIIESFTYHVNVQTGKRDLKLKYYERSK